MFFLGEVAALRGRLALLLKESVDRGDLLAEANFNNFGGTLARLGAGDPGGARHALEDVMARWPRRPFLTQHFTSLSGHVLIDLYLGQGGAALERLRTSWPELAGSLLLTVEAIRIFMIHLRARAALLAAAESSNPNPLLRAAECDARRLARERNPWAWPMARVIRAALCASAGQYEVAEALLGTAVDEFEAFDMRLFASAARRRRGELCGGKRGAALIADADSSMANQGVADHDRLAALHVPGDFDRSRPWFAPPRSGNPEFPSGTVRDKRPTCSDVAVAKVSKS